MASYQVSDDTEGLVEIVEGMTHDPDEFDGELEDLKQYIESLPNPYRTLKEFALYAYSEYL